MLIMLNCGKCTGKKNGKKAQEAKRTAYVDDCAGVHMIKRKKLGQEIKLHNCVEIMANNF